MDLNEIQVFIQVVQSGSFSHAAQKLGMPNSTVSSKVSSLEKRLNVTLIQRTTRKLNITPIGQAYYKSCLQGLSEIQAAESELSIAQGQPQGLLRITAPVELGTSVLPQLIADFTSQYPAVSIEVLLTERRVDLLGEGVDLAIRMGEMKDSTMIAKKIGNTYFAPFASPKYLKAQGNPTHPKDLRLHQILQFKPAGVDEWKMMSAKGTFNLPLPGKILTNDLNMVKMLAMKDGGVAFLPTFVCYPEIQAGKLLRILPEWRSTLHPVHFVYPEQKFVAPKLSVFMNMATDILKKSFEAFEI